MTDHSILSQSAADLPYSKEARIVSNTLKFLTQSLPRLLSQAFACSRHCEALDALDDARLAEMGLKRSEIAAHVAREAGLIAR